MEGAAEQESGAARRARWRSISVVYFTVFQMTLSFSVVLTGLWPYLDRLQPGVSKAWLGAAVGAHPLGQLAAAPAVGAWADRAGARRPLLASLLLAALASAGYSQLHAARPHALPAITITRFLVGVSSANIAVARSFVSGATYERERARGVAGAALAQVLGFAAGPALQALATPLGPGPPYLPVDALGARALRLDMYSAAGLLSAALALVNAALLSPAVFTESHAAAKEAMAITGADTVKEAWQCVRGEQGRRGERLARWALVGAFFVLSFNFVLLETLGTSLTMDQFGWGKRAALRHMGALMAAGAVLACATFLLIPTLSKHFDERALMVYGGFVMTGLASTLCIPWGPGPAPAAVAAELETEEVGGGCPVEAQPWCATSRGMTLTQFLLGYACVSVSYSLGITLIQTIFSRILGPRPQGRWMGVMTGAGCVSRAAGPLCVALVYARGGPAPTFLLTAALSFGAALALRALYPLLRAPDLAPRAELHPLQPSVALQEATTQNPSA